MKRWLTGIIITWLTQHAGFAGWVNHRAQMEIMEALSEYQLYCEAHDVDNTLEGFAAYMQYKLTGGPRI